MEFKKNFKLTLRIAKTELKTMFYSPVAWLVILIFVCQVGYAYTGVLEALFKSMERHGSVWSVSIQIFGMTMTSITSPIQQYIYLYIPLVTMGLMSREFASGSIKLLYSSPVKNSSIILGKFLAMAVYGLALMGILIVLATFTAMVTPNFDYPMVFVSFLGLYLLILAYSSIGLFMSTMTKYPVVAAIGTLAVLGVLNNIGSISSSIPVINDIVYWLELSGRSHVFLEGLLASENLIYFIIVITLFIVLSILCQKVFELQNIVLLF